MVQMTRVANLVSSNWREQKKLPPKTIVSKLEQVGDSVGNGALSRPSLAKEPVDTLAFR